MSAKDKIKEAKGEETAKEETKIPEPMQYSVAPSLLITMVREQRVYRFEMPIGAHLNECEEACNECLIVVKKMKEEALKKQEEAKKEMEAKEKSESNDEDLEKN